MKDAFTHWPEVEKRLKSSSQRLLVFDFDGTLSRIASTPRKARIGPGMADGLERLSRKAGTRVSVLSGRALKDVRVKVGVPGLIYGGNHGLEMKGRNVNFVHPAAKRLRGDLNQLAAMLRRKLRRFPGVLVENKKFTLSVHYRLVPRSWLPRFHSAFDYLVKRDLDGFQFIVRPGKMVYEIRPQIPWGKGMALRFLQNRGGAGTVTLFVGDDNTDEDAFLALRRRDTGIRVGRNPRSAATYFLRKQADVKRLMKKLEGI